jgi:adenylosuccinate lyase
MLAVVDKGVLRETAYSFVQRNAMESWKKGIPFKELVLKDCDIMSYLTEKEVDDLFDYSYHVRNIDYIFKRIGLL